MSDSYPPLVGGATRAVHALAAGLVGRGHAVEVLTPWQAGAPAREVLDGVTVHRVDGLFSRLWRRFRPAAIQLRYTPPPMPDLIVIWRARRLIKRSRPDVVVSYGWLTYSVRIGLAGTKVPLVLSVRDYANVCALRTLVRDGAPCDGPAWAKCLPCASRTYGTVEGVAAVASVLGQRRVLARRTAGIHACSGYVAEVTRRHLLRSTSGGPVSVVIPDYRLEAAPVGAAPPGLPPEPYILFVGPLRTIKGVDVLLRAYGSLRDAPPLVLIGTPSPDPLPPLPDGVVMIGAVGHSGVMAAWSGALFGVAPSVLPEPLGNVVHEALSCGKPVIGSLIGGHGEMIADGQNGLLVPNGDAPALARAMQLLVDDPALRARLASAAADSAARFTESEQLPAFEAFLSTVAATQVDG